MSGFSGAPEQRQSAVPTMYLRMAAFSGGTEIKSNEIQKTRLTPNIKLPQSMNTALTAPEGRESDQL
jgi:hypothetical protein